MERFTTTLLCNISPRSRRPLPRWLCNAFRCITCCIGPKPDSHVAQMHQPLKYCSSHKLSYSVRRALFGLHFYPPCKFNVQILQTWTLHITPTHYSCSLSTKDARGSKAPVTRVQIPATADFNPAFWGVVSTTAIIATKRRRPPCAPTTRRQGGDSRNMGFLATR